MFWGPLPRNTSLDLESVIAKSIERILTAFDDVVQVGLVKLRVNSVTEIKIIAETGTALL